jgi:hypothetical protein
MHDGLKRKALVRLGLGDRARTLDCLEQAYAEPRFVSLMSRLNFSH